MVNRKVKLLVGTHKGALIFESDESRQTWQAGDLLYKGWDVLHMQYDDRDGRLHAALAHPVYGPSLHFSDDWGAAWQQAQQSPAITRPAQAGRPFHTPEEAFSGESVADKPEKTLKIWHVRPGRASEPGVLYAGVQPAALFRSEDRGETWEINAPLYDHPHRAQWFPGAGGLALHSIVLDEFNAERLYVGVSAAGVYRSDDGGASWNPRNRNVRADFMPEGEEAEFGHCVHKVAAHPARPGLLYQQNHCGMYRSRDGGDTWEDIGEGRLPSRFGFPIILHPHDPDTVYVVPEESDEFRVSPEGAFAVWRSRNGGESWEKLTRGLPERAYLVALREATCADTLDETGIYVGTSTGQIFASRDGGDNWYLLADYLPPIYSLEAAVV